MNLFVKIISNSKLKRLVLLSLLLLLYIFVSAFSYTQAVCANISDAVFRLHVIANSDSPADQKLKYLVRDNVIEYINSITKNANSKNEIIEIVNKNIDEIENIASETLANNGYFYSVKVSIGNYSFPSKKYGDITLPPGYYDALKIEIGNATRSKLVVCNVSSSLFC